jgi:uncharacterized delta-60 repeat protein
MSSADNAPNVRVAFVAIAALRSLLVMPTAAAAPGDLDHTFSGDGWILTAQVQNESNAYLPRAVEDIAIQPDGRILAVGEIQDGSSNRHFGVFRYTRDGDLDPSFGAGGWVIHSLGSSDFPLTVALQKDGKILVGGESSCDIWFCFALVRYNPGGSLDPAFGDAGVVRTILSLPGGGWYELAVQNDGKILAVGSRVLYGRYPYHRIFHRVTRYLPNGDLDSSFSKDGHTLIDFAKGEASESARAVAIQGDGKIVIAGTTDDDFSVARLRRNGTLDPTFSGDGRQIVDFGVNRRDIAHSLDIQSDGRIILAGSTGIFEAYVSSFSDLPPRIALARLNRNGSLDSTFGRRGRQRLGLPPAGGYARAIVQHPDGRIIVGGLRYIDKSFPGNTDVMVARYRTNGTLDPSFGGDGIVTTDIGSIDGVAALGVQQDGKIIAAGGVTYNPGHMLFRYQAT